MLIESQLIYKGLLLLPPQREMLGRISRHSRATSGFAGLNPLKNQKLEAVEFKGHVQNSRKGSVVLVAGLGVCIGETC